MAENFADDIRMSDRIVLTRTHLLCTTLIGLGLAFGLGALGYAVEDRLMVAMAAVALVAGYLSQFAASNWMWSGGELWHGVMSGCLATAAIAWLIGAVAYFI